MQYGINRSAEYNRPETDSDRHKYINAINICKYIYLYIHLYIHTQFVIKMALYCNVEREIFLINDPRSIVYPYWKKN